MKETVLKTIGMIELKTIGLEKEATEIIASLREEALSSGEVNPAQVYVYNDAIFTFSSFVDRYGETDYRIIMLKGKPKHIDATFFVDKEVGVNAT